jgi:hypothetical protein
MRNDIPSAPEAFTNQCETTAAGIGRRPMNEGVKNAAEKLYEKRRRLQDQLWEVEQAIKDLDDPTVQKILNVVNVAEKR